MLQTWLNLSSLSYQISLNLNWIVYVDLKKSKIIQTKDHPLHISTKVGVNVLTTH